MKRYSALTITRKLSSGNSDIDKFLEEIKLNSKDNDKTLKWIPYHEFSNLKEIGKGGFGIVYEAIWHDAPEQKIDLIWNKKRVALKVLFNFRFNSSNDNSLSGNLINEFLGVSKDPESNHYTLVMQYASEGNLREYLDQNFQRFDWWKKINMLKDIVLGLQSIHSVGLVHNDFHSGNILRHGYGSDNLFKKFREMQKFRSQIGEAELVRLSTLQNKFIKKIQHPSAFYTSRLLDFTNLPQPKNAIKNHSLILESAENKQPFNLAKSNADFGQLAARRRTQSITSSTTNDNSRNNNERFKHSRSSSVKAKRLSRTFTNEEIAEEMRQLNMVPPLSGQSYGLNSINEENI
ncbi:19415_t:CDS:2 [Entrophospora sp. SA101]|nr:19415_t:CDS:2 [Entrophospora sp. SA101]